VQRQQEALAAAARTIQDRAAQDEAALRAAHARLVDEHARHAQEMAASRAQTDARAREIIAEAEAAGDAIRAQAERVAALERQRGRVQLDGLAVGMDLIETGAIVDIRKQEGRLRVVAAPGRRGEVAVAMPAIRPVLPTLRRMLETVRNRVAQELERLVGPLKARLQAERAKVREAAGRVATLEQRHLAGIDQVEALAGELGERKTAIEQRNARLVARTLQSTRQELERELEPAADLLAPRPR
jgi:hypothetical protein